MLSGNPFPHSVSPFQEIISNNFPISFRKENKGKSIEGLSVYINILCFSEDYQLFIRYLYVIFWNMSFQYQSSVMKKYFILKSNLCDFLGGSVAKTLSSQDRGPGFNPWSGKLFPQDTAKDPAWHNEDQRSCT